MTFEAVAKQAFDTLSFTQQAEVVDFIMYLSTKQKTEKTNSAFPFDIFAGDMTYIADDFDETPECFEEYV